MTNYLWSPPAIASLPVEGQSTLFPVNRLFFVGRNYQAHAAEMGVSVDKSADRPFYFTKSPRALVLAGGDIAYPLGTENYHYEMELVVALGKKGVKVSPENAHELIYGYACGLDMTRRDVQQRLRNKQQPWDLGKDVEQSAVCSAVVPRAGQVLDQGIIELKVNGQVKQHADVRSLIWSIREIIADLSTWYHLQPGDLIYTGTPEGVGPVLPGDLIQGQIEGVGEIMARVVAGAELAEKPL